ncbi:Phage head morphogenesis domain protein [Tenacibaculum dicentrarchi]|uniref:Phage head morphogenesis domain protein n=1 Tax=Tenacibaculum dicentrarchi TaxID=669041 RepID=A0ABM9NU42_9FLAO|nr:Phage head morphogenesis domain protein [Tenacibaculum dicentrarchi]
MKVLGYDVNIKKASILAKAETPNNSEKRNPGIIKIAQGFKDTSRKDIQKWRQALQLMQHPEEPKFNAYYDLISDLLTDGHLQSQIQMRKMSTLNSNFQVINRKTKDINEDLSFTLQQQWFYEFLEHAIDHIIFGTTLIEFSEFQNEKIKHTIIPRRNVVTTQKKIFPDLQKPQFIDYANPMFENWLIQIGKNGELGILNNIIPNLIWLRNVMQAWAEFCEKFGLPLITATTNTTDTNTINKVHAMLLQLGEASVGTFPTGTEIKFQEANRTDAYNTYLQFIKTNMDMVSKQLVGSTMLSDQGSNRSQTEVHERTLDKKIAQADKRLISFIINDQLFPLLEAQGYKISPEDMFEFKPAEEVLNLKDLWSITDGLLKSGYEIPLDWLSKSFNIPIDSKKKSITITPNKPIIALSEQRYPTSCCPSTIVAVSGAMGRLLTKLNSQLIKEIYNKSDTSGIAGKMIVLEALELFKGLKSKFSSTTQYTGPDLLMLQMMEYNLFEFTASKTEARLSAMTNLLIDKENKKLREYSDFKALCEKETKEFNSNWLQTEYNLSVAVGQNSASYIRMMAEKDTVTSYVQYQTIGDGSVRNSHKVLDGRIFNLSDKEAMDLVAPNGYGCRCELVQYIGDTQGKVTTGKYAKELLVEQDPKYRNSQFEVNRADLKQVFTKKQFYTDIKGLPEKLNKMTFDKYGAKSYGTFKNSLNNIKIDTTITGDNVKELFDKIKGTDLMGLEDYLGRKMILKEKVFKAHTKGKYLKSNENRHQLFPHIKDIIKNPDEVWYNNPDRLENQFQSRYVKFYKDKIIAVDCKLDKEQGLEIKTWYPIKKEDPLYRKGLLVWDKLNKTPSI